MRKDIPACEPVNTAEVLGWILKRAREMKLIAREIRSCTAGHLNLAAQHGLAQCLTPSDDEADSDAIELGIARPEVEGIALQRDMAAGYPLDQAKWAPS